MLAKYTFLSSALVMACSLLASTGCGASSSDDAASGTDDLTQGHVWDLHETALTDCPPDSPEPALAHGLRCEGVGDWSIFLETSNDDTHTTEASLLSGVDRFRLDLRSAISTDHSTFGVKGGNAVWRVRRDKQSPSSVVLPYIAGQRGFLVVAKVARDKPCVLALVDTDKDDPGALAAQIAEGADDATCPAKPPIR